MKLIVRVRPGVELTCASFWPSRELIRLDLPTFDRPRKANAGGPSGGKNLGSAAEVRNLAMIGFMKGITSVANEKKLLKPSPQIYGDGRRSRRSCRESRMNADQTDLLNR